MRNKILYVLTEESRFFYLLNKELNSLKIKFVVLNFNAKIPNIPCIIITTSDEYNKIQSRINTNVSILTYNKNEDFNQFIIKILASYRIGYKENYLSLVFSIDPGMRHFGLVIFLDDYFLNSYTVYEKDDLIKTVKDYVNAIQENSSELISLNFKLGSGIQSICKDLITRIYDVFENRKNLKIQLVNESKSSKIRIHENKRKIPKHEAAALVLSFRDGLEIKRNNFERIIIQNNENNNFKATCNDKILEEIAEKVLNGELSLNKSTEMLKSETSHY